MSVLVLKGGTIIDGTGAPGGEERWVQKATGIPYVIVNGRVTIREGNAAGDLPGKVLRSVWYRSPS